MKVREGDWEGEVTEDSGGRVGVPEEQVWVRPAGIRSERLSKKIGSGPLTEDVSYNPDFPGISRWGDVKCVLLWYWVSLAVSRSRW